MTNGTAKKKKPTKTIGARVERSLPCRLFAVDGGKDEKPAKKKNGKKDETTTSAAQA